MSRLGKLEDLGLGMGLSMHPAQKIKARHASLDGLSTPSEQLKMIIPGVIGFIGLNFIWGGKKGSAAEDFGGYPLWVALTIGGFSIAALSLIKKDSDA